LTAVSGSTGNCVFFERAAHFAGFKVFQKQLEPAGTSGYYG